MLAALHIYIVWRHYWHIISVVQHCYNYNFCSSFSSSPRGAPYVVELDSPHSPLHISSPPSLLSRQVVWNCPQISVSHSSHACFFPSRVVAFCSSCMSFSVAIQAQANLRLHFWHLTDAMLCVSVSFTLQSTAVNNCCEQCWDGRTSKAQKNPICTEIFNRQ